METKVIDRWAELSKFQTLVIDHLHAIEFSLLFFKGNDGERGEPGLIGPRGYLGLPGSQGNVGAPGKLKRSYEFNKKITSVNGNRVLHLCTCSDVSKLNVSFIDVH